MRCSRMHPPLLYCTMCGRERIDPLRNTPCQKDTRRYIRWFTVIECRYPSIWNESRELGLVFMDGGRSGTPKIVVPPFADLVFDDGSSEGSSGFTLLDDLHDLCAVLDDDEDADQETKTCSTNRDGDRRRKHRESMARFRQERRARIQHMDAQVHKVHLRLRSMLHWITAHRATHEANDCRCLAYADLVHAGEKLMDEQYALEQELHQRRRFSRMMSTETQRVEDDSEVRSAERTSITSSESPTGYWIQYLDGEQPFFYECESLESSVLAVRRGLQAIVQVGDTLTSDDATRACTTHCLGWKAERSIQRDETSGRPLLRFRFSRRVSALRTTVSELLDETWDLINSTELVARVYGSAVYSRVVQRLSDDAFINLRNSPVRNNHKRFRHFDLNVRLRSVEDDATMVLILMMDKEPRQEQLESWHGVPSGLSPDSDRGQAQNGGQGPGRKQTQAHGHVAWLKEGGASLRFSHVEDDAIEIEYTGFVECYDDEHAGHLMLECCAVLLRWEHLVVPPRLLAL